MGEVDNLYKTSKKRSKGRKHKSRDKNPNETITIDLHGMTADDALAKLEERLPTWVDTAMKGQHPWVISINIICGGGNQILSEVVENWIRYNENVSNAPKKRK